MMIKVENVEFSYNGTPVLMGVSLEIKKGQVVAVLGPNGAGKTTLLRCMNGVLKPVMGTVMVEEVPINIIGIKELAKKIGYVPQHISSSFMSVFDAVLLGRKPHIKWGVGVNDFNKVEQTLELMGLKNKALKLTSELSGGELQKVMLARALVQEPEVLFLDEPTNNLDPKNQLEIMSIVRSIAHQKSITAIAVMHDLNLALRYADSLIMMKEGKIYHAGSRESINSRLVKDVYEIDTLVQWIDEVPVVIPVEGNYHHPTCKI